MYYNMVLHGRNYLDGASSHYGSTPQNDNSLQKKRSRRKLRRFWKCTRNAGNRGGAWRQSRWSKKRSLQIFRNQRPEIQKEQKKYCENKTKQNQNMLVYRCVVRAHRGPLQLTRWNKQNIHHRCVVRTRGWVDEAAWSHAAHKNKEKTCMLVMTKKSLTWKSIDDDTFYTSMFSRGDDANSERTRRKKSVLKIAVNIAHHLTQRRLLNLCRSFQKNWKLKHPFWILRLENNGAPKLYNKLMIGRFQELSRMWDSPRPVSCCCCCCYCCCCCCCCCRCCCRCRCCRCRCWGFQPLLQSGAFACVTFGPYCEQSGRELQRVAQAHYLLVVCWWIDDPSFFQIWMMEILSYNYPKFNMEPKNE